MDPATLIGIAIAIATTFIAMLMSGMNPAAIFFADTGSIILVTGGAIGVSLASGTLPQAVNALKAVVKALTGGKAEDPTIIVGQLVAFADVARREGLLALEEQVAGVDDPFLRKGLEMAVDGTDPELLRETLEIDLTKTASRHQDAAAFWTNCAGFAPAMGMVGTVIGLVDMLGKLEDPTSLGPAMAIAFLTTLWGAFLANYVFAPIASKLKKMSADELAQREILIEGILAIQAGSNPRAVAGRLVSFLPPAIRDDVANRDAKSA